MICDRCRKQTQVFSCSWFNTQDICLDCQRQEEKHHARDQEREAVLRGDMNFPGVGWPGVDGRVPR